MSISLTKTDLQKALSGLATKKDLDNKIDEALAEFRMSLNKDFEKFTTKEDLEKLATKDDMANLKTDLTDYIHEVADTIIDAFDNSYSKHLSKHHSKISVTTI